MEAPASEAMAQVGILANQEEARAYLMAPTRLVGLAEELAQAPVAATAVLLLSVG